MKVKELKELLLKYPDNMDIFAHNGFVDDFQDIIVGECDLCKEKPSHVLQMIHYQEKEKGCLSLTESKRLKTEWKYLSEYSDTFPKAHSFKTVLLIQPIRKNKVSVDYRWGKTYY